MLDKYGIWIPTVRCLNFYFVIFQAGTSTSWWGARFLISLVELHSRNILRMVAFSEIFLMPLVTTIHS